LVLRSDEFECQGQRSRSSGTKNALCIYNTPAVRTEWNASLQITSHKQQARRFDHSRGVSSPECVPSAGRATAGLCHAFVGCLCYAAVLLFFNHRLEQRDVSNYQTDLHQICRFGRHMALGVQFGIGSAIGQGTLPWQPILGVKSATRPGLAFHNGWQEQLNVFAPNSHEGRVWSFARTSLNVNFKSQRSRSTGTKNALCTHNTPKHRPNETSCKQQTQRFRRCGGVTSAACVRWAWRATTGLCHAFLVYFILRLVHSPRRWTDFDDLRIYVILFSRLKTMAGRHSAPKNLVGKTPNFSELPPTRRQSEERNFETAERVNKKITDVSSTINALKHDTKLGASPHEVFLQT